MLEQLLVSAGISRASLNRKLHQASLISCFCGVVFFLSHCSALSLLKVLPHFFIDEFAKVFFFGKFHLVINLVRRCSSNNFSISQKFFFYKVNGGILYFSDTCSPLCYTTLLEKKQKYCLISLIIANFKSVCFQDACQTPWLLYWEVKLMSGLGLYSDHIKQNM